VAKYYVEKSFLEGYDAGVKPKNDLNQILKTMGFQSFQEVFGMKTIVVSAEDITFLYYPFACEWEQRVLNQLSESNMTTILFIMDIPSMVFDTDMEEELSVFNQATYLIVHNERMKNWLIEKGIDRPMECLEIFDYLMDDTFYHKIPDRKFSHEVVFAGCIQKRFRKFLYDPTFKHDFQFNVYGSGLADDIENETTNYCGIYTPEVTPAYLKGSFGLHWNGDSKDTGEGRVANYATIATSHKFSLYLLAKLPVICWDQSSEAELIEKENLGFLISSLDEIDEKLENISEKQYKEMQRNVSKYSAKIKQGYFFKQVINEVVHQIQQARQMQLNLEKE